MGVRRGPWNSMGVAPSMSGSLILFMTYRSFPTCLVLHNISRILVVTKLRFSSAVGGRCSLRAARSGPNLPRSVWKYIGSIYSLGGGGLYACMSFCSLRSFSCAVGCR
eukprot:IDg7426t1